MAIAIAVGPGTGSLSYTAPAGILTLNGVSAGETIVALFQWTGAGTRTITSVAVNGESNLTLGSSNYHTGDDYSSCVGILDNVSAGGNKTLTVTFSGNTAVNCMAFSLSGCNTSGALDTTQYAEADGSTSNPATLSITTAEAGEFIATICHSKGNDPTTVGGVLTTAQNLADNAWYEAGGYVVDAGAAGAKTCSHDWSGSGAAQWSLFAVAIKPAGGGGSSWGGANANNWCRIVVNRD